MSFVWQPCEISFLPLKTKIHIPLSLVTNIFQYIQYVYTVYLAILIHGQFDIIPTGIAFQFIAMYRKELV